MTHILPLLTFFLFFILNFPHNTLSQRGEWQVLQTNIGISAMHMQLLNNDNVIIFDRADFGPSNISLPAEQCHPRPNRTDCTAHSVEYNVLTNTVNALNILTDTWCSSGTTLNDGTLLQSGGFGNGERTIRTIKPCSKCDWSEFPNQLFRERWYATNHILPDGRAIIIGGRNESNYEFYPKSEIFDLPFLLQTRNDIKFYENNLYPFVFLNVDGNLFIFANNRAILFDYVNNKVIRDYPTIPGGEPRNYPSTGSAVLLPLKNLELGLQVRAEVLICGGAPPGSYDLALNQTFKQALNTCARIVITDPNPTWVIELMPMARTMGDMIILPNGDVTIINGAEYGCAGWELGRNPILNPVIYHPDSTSGPFEVMTPTRTPRMYHSTAILLRDGRVLVGGSNPHQFYNFTDVLYPTDLTLEAFSPPYLDPSKSGLRPTINYPGPNARIGYSSNLMVNFSVYGFINPSLIKITMIRPGFSTHSFSMSQRMLVLTNTMPVIPVGRGLFQVNVLTPGSTNIAPPGYYMLFVVHQDIPSQGVWVQLL